MSQPEATAEDGASALLAAANKSGGRRTRYVPAAKVDKAAVAAPTGAQQPADAPEPAPAAQEPAKAPEPAQRPSQPVAEAPPAPPAQEPPPPAEEQAAESGAEVAFPAKPLSFESVFTRRTHDMDPEMFAMISQRQVKLLKSLASIVNMFNDRVGEYHKSVTSAVAAGFPKDELARLAITHDCAPVLESILGELPDTR